MSEETSRVKRPRKFGRIGLVSKSPSPNSRAMMEEGSKIQDPFKDVEAEGQTNTPSITSMSSEGSKSSLQLGEEKAPNYTAIEQTLSINEKISSVDKPASPYVVAPINVLDTFESAKEANTSEKKSPVGLKSSASSYHDVVEGDKSPLSSVEEEQPYPTIEKLANEESDARGEKSPGTQVEPIQVRDKTPVGWGSSVGSASSENPSLQPEIINADEMERWKKVEKLPPIPSPTGSSGTEHSGRVASIVEMIEKRSVGSASPTASISKSNLGTVRSTISPVLSTKTESISSKMSEIMTLPVATSPTSVKSEASSGSQESKSSQRKSFILKASSSPLRSEIEETTTTKSPAPMTTPVMSERDESAPAIAVVEAEHGSLSQTVQWNGEKSPAVPAQVESKKSPIVPIMTPSRSSTPSPIRVAANPDVAGAADVNLELGLSEEERKKSSDGFGMGFRMAIALIIFFLMLAIVLLLVFYFLRE